MNCQLVALKDALSIVLNKEINLDTMIDIIGHDGSEIVFKDFKEPMCRRGFHINELQYCALSYGCGLIVFSRNIAVVPTVKYTGKPYIIQPHEINPKVFDAIIYFGINAKGIPHATCNDKDSLIEIHHTGIVVALK